MNITPSTPSGRYRISLIIEALEIAVNSLEFDGEQDKAGDMALIISELKEAE